MTTNTSGTTDAGRRELACWPFPAFYLAIVIATGVWAFTQPARSGAGMGWSFILAFTVPAVVVYLLMLVLLRRWLRKLTVTQLYAFSLLTAMLTPVTTGVTLWILAIPHNPLGPQLSDEMFFWFAPFGPTVVATTMSLVVVTLVRGGKPHGFHQ